MAYGSLATANIGKNALCRRLQRCSVTSGQGRGANQDLGLPSDVMSLVAVEDQQRVPKPQRLPGTSLGAAQASKCSATPGYELGMANGSLATAIIGKNALCRRLQRCSVTSGQDRGANQDLGLIDKRSQLSASRRETSSVE